MQTTLYIKSILALSMLGLITTASAMQIFTITSMPISGHFDKQDVCYLDVANKIEDQINANIKGNKIINVQDMKSPQYIKKYKLISKSMACRFAASQLGIKKLPAIVFANHYVVYGETNIDEAKHLFQAYQESHA